MSKLLAFLKHEPVAIGGILTAVLAFLAQNPDLGGKVLSVRHLKDLLPLVPLIVAALARARVTPVAKVQVPPVAPTVIPQGGQAPPNG
jgi:hypothetical protein